MYDPFRHAQMLGVGLEWGDPGEGRDGLYLHHVRTIILREGLNDRVARCVLAHEIVHHEFGDEPTADGAWGARREARCDRIAARRLIDWDTFKGLVCGTGDPGQWAVDLKVTAWILQAYRDDLSPGELAVMGAVREGHAA